jgi:hypothetical protein
VDVVVGKTGATADITMWRDRELELRRAQFFQRDKACVGEPKIDTPDKKSPGADLSNAQKKDNQSKAKTRIFVEHLIRLIKI